MSSCPLQLFVLRSSPHVTTHYVFLFFSLKQPASFLFLPLPAGPSPFTFAVFPSNFLLHPPDPPPPFGPLLFPYFSHPAKFFPSPPPLQSTRSPHVGLCHTPLVFPVKAQSEIIFFRFNGLDHPPLSYPVRKYRPWSVSPFPVYIPTRVLSSLSNEIHFFMRPVNFFCCFFRVGCFGLF